MYIPNFETLTNTEISEQISSRLSWIESLRRGLPYADHGAYSQDLNTISGYYEEIAALNGKLNSQLSSEIG